MDVYRNDHHDKLGQVYTWTSPNIPLHHYPCFKDKAVQKVATGGRHTIFLTVDHAVFTCGKNDFGQLGNGAISDEVTEEPNLVKDLLGTEVVDVVCGLSHSAAVTSGGLVYVWGNSKQGQCGTGKLGVISSPQLLNIYIPSQICVHGVEEPEERVKIKQISCGATHTLALSEEGEVWTWGSGMQLGVVNMDTSLKPIRLDFLIGRNVLGVSAGGEHSLALLEKSVLTGVVARDSPSRGSREKSVGRGASLCSQCKKDVYKFSLTESISVTTHDQKCPLGLDLQEINVQADAVPAGFETLNSDGQDTGVTDDVFDETSSYLDIPDAISLQDIDVSSGERTMQNEEANGTDAGAVSDPLVCTSISTHNIADTSANADTTIASSTVVNSRSGSDTFIDSNAEADTGIVDYTVLDTDVEDSGTVECNDAQQVASVYDARSNEHDEIEMQNPCQVEGPDNCDKEVGESGVGANSTDSVEMESMGVGVEIPGKPKRLQQLSGPVGNVPSAVGSCELAQSAFTQLELGTAVESARRNPQCNGNTETNCVNAPNSAASQSSVQSTSDVSSASNKHHTFINEKDAKDYLSKRLSDHEVLDDGVEKQNSNANAKRRSSDIRGDLNFVVSSVVGVPEQIKSLSTKMFTGMLGFVSKTNVELENSVSRSESTDSLVNSTPSQESSPGLLRNVPLETSLSTDLTRSVCGLFETLHDRTAEDNVQGPTSNDVLSAKRKSRMELRRTMPLQPISEMRSSYETDCCIHTEVWSWGHGGSGQLGHSDQLDRPQPCFLQSLSGFQVIKISAGKKHSLAVTTTGNAYAWGDNSNDQLVVTENCSSVPKKVKLLSSVNIWDVSAGETCSLFLADGMGFQPDLYYCGGDSSSIMESSAIRFAAVKKMGWLKQICAGGEICACVVDKNITGHVATLHEFAATERCFYQQIYRLLHEVLVPLTVSDEFESFQLVKSLNTVFKQMVADFSSLTDKVGLNVTELISVLQTSSSLSRITLIGDSTAYVNVFLKYSKTFGDVLALGGFEHLTKVFSMFLEKNNINLTSLSEDAKVEKSSNNAVTLRRLLQIPLRRLKDYERLTGKLAVGSSEPALMLRVTELWEQLKQTAKLDHNAADNTRLFWENCTPKFVDQFRSPGRRLLRESKNHPLSLQNAGSFSFHWFLLFNDIFVHMRSSGYSSHQIFPLSTVWSEPLQDGDNSKFAFKIVFPEASRVLYATDSAQKAEWLAAINMAVDGVLNDNRLSHLRSEVGTSLAPPLSRHASYAFYKSGSLVGAKYNGMWYNGRMHGDGELTWTDGRIYFGKFKQGQQHGYGVLTIPKPDKTYEVQEGNWKAGQLFGLGKIKFSNGDVYEGYFADGQRHGHGVYRQGVMTSPVASLYIGEWSNDKRNGYGVMDDVILDTNIIPTKNKLPSDPVCGNGEKYMGMWMDDARHGNGILVTMDGMYLEGNFVQNKMTGQGLMWSEDNTCYEGEFYNGTQLYGRGSMTLSSGHTIDGHFSGSWNEGIKVNGTFRKPNVSTTDRPPSPAIPRPQKYGSLSVAADRKWTNLFLNCSSSLGCHGNRVVDSTKAWEAVAVKVSAGRKSLTASKDSKDRSMLNILEQLEKIPPHKTGNLTINYHTQIKEYLVKAFDTPFHPLGKLIEGLVNVYRATYMGVGAHPKLLYHAVCEVESFVKRLYDIVRILFPDLPPGGDPVQIFESEEHEEDTEGEIVAVGSLLHPILLPKIYPPLFTLYALYNENDDERYWERILRWNRQPDIALMSYLGVDQKFWCVDDSIPLHRISRLKDYCYSSSVDTLQQLSTMFSPAEKLKVIVQTFDEVTKSVQTTLGAEYLWNMDDLFPVFQYITVRARIRHLGAEIHLIDDLMEKHLEHGELGIMFTTLKACYFQVLNEKINL